MPACVIEEFSKDKSGTLMCRCFARYHYKDDSKADKRRIEGDLGDEWQRLRVCIEDECESISDFICHNDVPGLNRAATSAVSDVFRINSRHFLPHLASHI